MATKRPAPPPLSYKLRLATYRTEYQGTHGEGIRMLFVSLPDAPARLHMLGELAEAHHKMAAREGKAAGPDGLVLVYRAASGAVLEFDGAAEDGVASLLALLPDALARRKLIDRLEKTHGRLLATEDKAQDGSQVHPDSALPSKPGLTRYERKLPPEDCGRVDRFTDVRTVAQDWVAEGYEVTPSPIGEVSP